MGAEPLEIHLDDQDISRSLRRDVRMGLTAEEKWLPPKWFYDSRGSELFDEITRLPEYYPTRAERAVLAERAVEIAELTGAKTLIELGSGSSEKTRLLLDAFTQRGELGSFVPLDVSVSALAGSTAAVAADYPGLRVRGIVGDFTRHLDHLPTGGRRLVIFLGGTIGNLLPVERAEFLTGMRAALEGGDWLLVGTDLVKDPAVIVPAYDDAAGVTAEFNRNVLRVLNRELDADFDPSAFAHVALWNPEQEWIEMRLRAERSMRVKVLDLVVDFAAGEDLRTEVSAKFRPEGIAGELAATGFRTERFWTDPADLFGVTLARAE
ncbi:L-histidine N(alpha)-methyltransferase [Micromonospora lutea]|uniref:Histidine N-alpha-methyltransferase n=1 Tax=Micromonospora lutea TaxID=419825 RepID=A0ABQ4IRC8_9ACTN|nr:L-histidine N(alpha)-methyltransferase [Micromonospora lutea]GIJ20462.1 histidine N-alpha-methyltransferase [Micromonospora lutea]